MKDFVAAYVDVMKALWCGCVLVAPVLVMDAWLRQGVIIDQLVELKCELDARADDGEDGNGEDDAGENED